MHAHLLASIPDDLFTMTVPVAEKVIRTVAVYAGLLLLLRLAGKRDLAQLNTFDLVVLLLLSNVVQNAIIGTDDSLLGGMLGAATLIGVNWFIARLALRSDRAVRLLEGTSTTLAHDGRLDTAALNRLGLRKDDVLLALREQGALSIEDVQDAALAPGGSILLTLKPAKSPATGEDITRLEAKLDRLLANT